MRDEPRVQWVFQRKKLDVKWRSLVRGRWTSVQEGTAAESHYHETFFSGTGFPAGLRGAGISPTAVGLAGSLMSTMRMPGWMCGHESGSMAPRGSPTPQ